MKNLSEEKKIVDYKKQNVHISKEEIKKKYELWISFRWKTCMKRKEKREYKKNMNYGLAFDKKRGYKRNMDEISPYT